MSCRMVVHGLDSVSCTWVRAACRVSAAAIPVCGVCVPVCGVVVVCVCVCGLLADSRAAVICWLCFPVSYLVYTHFFSTNMRYECLSAVQVPLVFLFSGFCLACSEEGAISQTMWTSVCPHVVACPPTWWRTCGARLMAWVRAWS